MVPGPTGSATVLFLTQKHVSTAKQALSRATAGGPGCQPSITYPRASAFALGGAFIHQGQGGRVPNCQIQQLFFCCFTIPKIEEEDKERNFVSTLHRPPV
ncbi:hypothetical protein ACLOJK_004999 [Asimina triloba]